MMKNLILSLLLLSVGQVVAQPLPDNDQQAQEASLANALQAADYRTADELLQLGADVNQLQPDGTSALHWAVYHVQPELVETLLRREANPNVENAFGSTPLMEAVKVADLAMVNMLLDAGADVNAANQDKQTPLLLAVDTGEYEVVQALVDAGAEVNVTEQVYGQTALMWAASGARPNIVKLLIDQGAAVDIRADINDWAVQITSEPRAQYRPAAGLTPLLYAARAGCQGCVDSILDAGADINRPSPEGVNALMIALDNGHYNLANHLLDQGINPHVWDWWGRTALYVATDANSGRGGFGGFGGPSGSAPAGHQDDPQTALDIMRRLLDMGVDPNTRLNMHRPGRGGGSGRFSDDLLTTGATPLLRAAATMDLDAIHLLLEYDRVLVDLPNVMGVTPLMAAAGFGAERGIIQGEFGPEKEPGALQAVQLLHDAGADINARITDTSSLTAWIARPSGMTQRQGQTALFAAARMGWVDVATYLLDQGAELDVRDDLGRTVVDAASGKSGGRFDAVHEEAVAFLEELGAEASDYDGGEGQ